MIKTYLFPSKSQPKNPPHQTQLFENGAVLCSCKAFKDCWHKKLVRTYQPIGPLAVPECEGREIVKLWNEGNIRGAMQMAYDLFNTDSAIGVSVEETAAFVAHLVVLDEDMRAAEA